MDEHISRHPYHVFKRALQREGRIVSRINSTFVTGDESYRKRLFKILWETYDLKDRLQDLMKENPIKSTFDGSL